MTPDDQAQPAHARVSIIARVVPALSYALPALGAAVSGLLLLRVLRAMRHAEAAGIAAVTAGIAEANVAVVVTLYLALFVGIGGVVIGLVRLFTTTVTADASAWYYLIAGVLGLIPMFALWHAQSVLLDAILSRSGGGVSVVAGQITLFSTIAIVLGSVSIVIVLASSFVTLPAKLRSKRKWAPLIAMLLMETAIIAMTVTYHLRTAWLYSEYRNY